MDKLIELLNEYDSNWGFTDYWSLFNSMNEWISGTEDLQVISKKFWFIKWLVDNDKIDLLKLDNRIALSEFNKVERVIMNLSIQDNPIEYLISVLR
jgi:hypothetical protein